jgi:hypothetical protein
MRSRTGIEACSLRKLKTTLVLLHAALKINIELESSARQSKYAEDALLSRFRETWGKSLAETHVK